MYKSFYLFLLILLVISTTAFAITTNIIYQGYLTQSNIPAQGTIDNCSFDIKLKGGGASLWNLPNTSIEANNGAYAKILPVPLSALHPSNQYELEITINGTPLIPNVNMAAVPFAYYASSLDGIVNVFNKYTGIGTTTPLTHLHIIGSSSANIRLEDQDGESYQISSGDNGLNGNFNISDIAEGVRLTIDTFGHVGIGTTAPAHTLHVSKSANGPVATIENTANGAGAWGLQVKAGRNVSGTDFFIYFTKPNGVVIGAIQQSGDSVIYHTTSDKNLKKNIVQTHFGLKDVMKIRVKDFCWKTDQDEKINTGLIAQELDEIYPEAVSKPSKENKIWGIDYGRLTPLVVKGLQDLKREKDREIEKLKKYNHMLTEENEKLKGRYQMILSRIEALESNIGKN
ncbi:tail fiber domain-containing protein [Spirochaetota bacterium]